MLAIGLMSGTSMDGIDAALIETDGKVFINEIANISLDYHLSFHTLLKAAEYAVNQSLGDLTKAESIYSTSLLNYLKTFLTEDRIESEYTILSNYLYQDSKRKIQLKDIITHSTELHALAVKKLLVASKMPSQSISIIGYHGQTLYHQPRSKISLQVGDGKLLSALTGISVINHFRHQDIEWGGEGAPLAPLYHQALAIRDNLFPLAVVNCGGIANISIISGKEEDDLLGFDIGPGNALIDRYVKEKTQGREKMDKDGYYGKQGKSDTKILEQLYKNSIPSKPGFYDMHPPKSLDINELQLIPELNTLSLADGCRTLESFTAEIISQSIQYAKTIPYQWVLAGGGWYNPIIRIELENRLKRLNNKIKISTADKIGWNLKAMEAQIFAYLAVRSLLDLPITFPTTTGIAQPMSGGVLHKTDKPILMQQLLQLLIH